MREAESRWVVVGRVRRPHGVTGKLKIESRTEPPAQLLQYCPSLAYLPAHSLKQGQVLVRTPALIESLRPLSLAPLAPPDGQGLFFARAQGVTTLESAKALAGVWLLLNRTLLTAPAGETLWVDLVGLTAQDQAGNPIGQVIAVRDFGAGALLEIAPTDGGQSFFIRYAEPELIKLDLAKGIIVLNPLKEFAPDKKARD